jgi:uncharacterized UBP type Zn finger protein
MYLMTKIDENEKSFGGSGPSQHLRFQLSQRLQCNSCKKCRYMQIPSEGIEVPVPARQLPQQSAELDVVEYECARLTECLDGFQSSVEIEGFKCPACQQTTTASQYLHYSYIFINYYAIPTIHYCLDNIVQHTIIFMMKLVAALSF